MRYFVHKGFSPVGKRALLLFALLFNYERRGLMKTGMELQRAFDAPNHFHCRSFSEQCAVEVGCHIMVIKKSNMAGGVSTVFKKRGNGIKLNKGANTFYRPPALLKNQDAGKLFREGLPEH